MDEVKLVTVAFAKGPDFYLATFTEKRLHDQDFLHYFLKNVESFELGPYLNSSWFPVVKSVWGSPSVLDKIKAFAAAADDRAIDLLEAHWDELLLNADARVEDTLEEEGMVIAPDSDLAIWWTDQDSSVLFENYFSGCDALMKVPLYIRQEIGSRLGRDGRGRLWVSDRTPFEGIKDWEPSAADALGYTPLGDCGGIVILERHVDYLMKNFPGLFTYPDLSPIGLGTSPKVRASYTITRF